MIPDFALSLTSDGLTLLRRKAGGWLALAEADLSADAFDEVRLRAQAEDPAGAQVALFLPNDQVRYLEMPDPGTEAERRAALEAALEGATPYRVSDLVIDWSLSGTTLLGAAVARESLEEAEGFLRDRGFEPVLFAAIPPSGTFRGTAYFGPAESWTGATPERPGKVIVLPPEITPEPEVARQDEPEPAQTPIETPVVETAPVAAEPAVAPDAPAAPATAAAEEETAEPRPAPDEAPAEPASPVLPDPVPAAPAVSAPTEPPAAPSFTSVRATRDAVPPAPPTAPRLSMGRETPSAARPAPTPIAPPELRGPAEAAGPDTTKRRGLGFGKRRGSAEPEPAARPTFAPIKTPPEPETGSETTQGIKQVTPRPPISHPLDPAGSAPVSGQARVAALRQEAGHADAPMHSRRAAASLTPEEERDRLTVFGERGGQQRVGGKPRFLGLILTILLLLFLAAVAAFSSVFLRDEISRFFAPAQTEDTALALPETETEPLPAAEEDPAALEEEDADAALAALELPPAASEGLEDAPAPRVTERNQMTTDEAAENYAVTGIWQRAPNAPARPPQTSAEDVYVASIDPEVQQFDAVALPDLDAGPREDLSLEPVRLPPGPGVRYDLDARGLVKATPEGNVSPDGVRIFTGLPPQVPPLREPAAEAQPETPAGDPATEATAEPSEPDEAGADTADESPAPAADPALSGPRPRARPGDLIEQTERAVLGGVSLAELEKMRPQMRPLTAQEEAMALDLPVTEQAIGASLTPLPRPRSMEAIVQEAVKQASNTPAEPAAAPAPNIPQNASVSKSATLSNQIDLREISLIGVYGNDSNRRALVRLPSGKYQKVQVGDSIDGGRIAAIAEDELRYVKAGRNVVLKMPRS
ncbi:hypothetical protein PVT71_02865 [Salipiger sp. H15]|uniref:Translation initiation factor 2 n=1 Tax=Alloyangia sp. H15 TaxID=3029062 RepID=A0AAU8AIC1_9RHOB